MAADADGVFDRLRDLRLSVVTPLVEASGGQVVKTLSDGILFGFLSPTVAVAQTIAIRQRIALREAVFPENRCIRFRVGINQDKVLCGGDDLVGDVVNSAARLEDLSLPGGLCVSKADRVRWYGCDRAQRGADGTAVYRAPVPEQLGIARTGLSDQRD